MGLRFSEMEIVSLHDYLIICDELF